MKTACYLCTSNDCLIGDVLPACQLHLFVRSQRATPCFQNYDPRLLRDPLQFAAPFHWPFCLHRLRASFPDVGICALPDLCDVDTAGNIWDLKCYGPNFRLLKRIQSSRFFVFGKAGLKQQAAVWFADLRAVKNQNNLKRGVWAPHNVKNILKVTWLCKSEASEAPRNWNYCEHIWNHMWTCGFCIFAQIACYQSSQNLT